MPFLSGDLLLLGLALYLLAVAITCIVVSMSFNAAFGARRDEEGRAVRLAAASIGVLVSALGGPIVWLIWDGLLRRNAPSDPGLLSFVLAVATLAGVAAVIGASMGGAAPRTADAPREPARPHPQRREEGEHDP